MSNKTKLDKQIDYIQMALKLDAKKNPNRPIGEFAELTQLIQDQYQDMTNFTIKRSGKGEDVMDQKSTVSIEECKSVAVGIDGKTPFNNEK